MKDQPTGKRETPPDIKDRAFNFAVRIVGLCKVLESESRFSRTLANQLLRSGTSIGTNIKEAQSGQSKADFTAKIYIACKEARETNYWLRLLAATDLMPENKLAQIIDESHQIVAILTAIAKNARANPRK